MKVYIAGKLGTGNEKEVLEKVAKLCESLGLDTFLPHRDVGVCEGIEDVNRIFDEDIKKGFNSCKMIIAILDGLHVGAGTSWELGYAYAKGIPAIGLKTDEPIHEGLEYLSAILIGSMPIVNSLKELEKKIKEILKNKN